MIPQGYEPRRSADEHSRDAKARMIVRLIGGESELRGRRILEVGCGSGVLTAALAKHARPDGEVWGVDVVERLLTNGGFKFILVDGVGLPFETGTIDIVVSNHVVEHVGSLRDQVSHLGEIKRVLDRAGFCYLATPNRWWVWEPHFSLPFLSWLPVSAQNFYVRVTRRAETYDCRLLSRRELFEMAGTAGLSIEELTSEAIRQAISNLPLTRYIPTWFMRLFARLSPTFVVKLRSV